MRELIYGAIMLVIAGAAAFCLCLPRLFRPVREDGEARALCALLRDADLQQLVNALTALRIAVRQFQFAEPDKVSDACIRLAAAEYVLGLRLRQALAGFEPSAVFYRALWGREQ